MTWQEALANVDTVESFGQMSDITGVQYDSRRVLPGDVFVAMKGGTVDGNKFIESAITRGAAAIVTDSRESFESLRTRIPAALVQHGRRALATVSANIFGHPERKLAVSAVTGTNGKTTTAYLLEQTLKYAGRTCVLLGTIETHIGDEVRPSEHTTPEARDLYKIFADGVSAGATECVMEMSSHALEQERVWGIPVDVAMFTNLTQDHLDYHITMQAYLEAKARLFDGVGAPAPRVAVINADDAAAPLLIERAKTAGSELMTYGILGQGTHRAESTILRAGHTVFEFVTSKGTIEIHSPLTGRVNVYNLLAASCAALARGLTLEQIAEAAKHLGQVPGRFQVVNSGTTGITVVVDYAHTDDALKNLIALARELTQGRVITLFGCGGDRDRTKRPKMGRAAAQGSDLVVVTATTPAPKIPPPSSKRSSPPSAPPQRTASWKKTAPEPSPLPSAPPAPETSSSSLARATRRPRSSPTAPSRSTT